MSKQLLEKKSIKNITFSLIGIIFLLILLLGFAFYNSLKTQQTEDDRVKSIIANFEEKFHSDSIKLVKYNKLLIDKISQTLIDSISLVYEKKLKTAYENGYLDLSFSNKKTEVKEKVVEIISNLNEENLLSKTKQKTKKVRGRNVSQKASNVTSYSKLKNNNSYTPFSESKRSNNVTSYSKLNRTKENYSNQNKNTSNVTSYSKLKRNNTGNNVTSYSKLNNNKSSNVTTYSKLNNKTKVAKSTYSPPSSNNSSKLVYANPKLNAAINIHDIEITPVFPGCEQKNSEISKKNCFSH